MSVTPEGIGLIQELQESFDVIPVAGACAEVYTQGQSVTGVIDIVIPVEERDEFQDEFRDTYNFSPRSEEVGKFWEGTYEGKEQVLHIVDSQYSGRTMIVDLDKIGMGTGEVEMASPEDVLVNYLSECKNWGTNCDRAYLLYRMEVLDEDYLMKRAEEADVVDYLDEDLLAREGRA